MKNYEVLTPEVESRMAALTETSRQVMVATLMGVCAKDIAERFDTTTDNIRHIRSRAFKKFGVKNSAEFALRILNPELHNYLKTIL